MSVKSGFVHCRMKTVSCIKTEKINWLAQRKSYKGLDFEVNLHFLQTVGTNFYILQQFVSSCAFKNKSNGSKS